MALPETIYGQYQTGTVSVTQNSAVVTGTGTVWNGTQTGATVVNAGDIFTVDDSRLYFIKSVDSATQITLDKPYAGTTASGQNYRIIYLAAAHFPTDTATKVSRTVERYERIASTAESALQPENLIAGDDIAIVDSSGNKVFSVKPNTFLRLSGGIVSGNIFGNSVDFTLGKTNAAGRTIIRGGSTYNDGATLYLYGKDFSDALARNGEFILLVNDGVNNSSLRLTPLGKLWVGGKEVALLESTVAAALTCNGCGESTPFELTDGNAASQIKSGFYKTESNASQGGAAGLPYAAIIQAMQGSTRGARILFPLNESYEFFSPYMQVFNGAWGPLKSFVMQGDNITGNAASASRLETSRKINNVPFNGTSDIAVTDLYTKTTNCFRLRSGWQMCYGTTQLPSGSSGETITFPLPFNAMPNVQATIVNSSVALGIPTVDNTSATFVTSSNNAYIRWIAVGSWS